MALAQFIPSLPSKIMQLKVVLIILLICAANAGNTQSAEDSIKQTINTLFTGMKSSNRVLLQSVFADSAMLQTVAQDKVTGIISVKSEPIGQFIQQVSTLPKGAADERITYDMIKVDADLASVWTPYRFYFNGGFSHCGVNSFQLVRINREWKIQYIIDTRRMDNCSN